MKSIRLFALFALLVAICSSVVLAARPSRSGVSSQLTCSGNSSVSLPAIVGVSPGGDVVVPIHVDPADGVISMDFAITYDGTLLTATNVTTTAFTSGWNLEWNVPSSGDLRIVMYSSTALSGSGDV